MYSLIAIVCTFPRLLRPLSEGESGRGDVGKTREWCHSGVLKGGSKILEIEWLLEHRECVYIET